MFICPDCRSVYVDRIELCERDQEKLIPVQANQNQRTYPLLNQELDGRYHLIGGLGQGGVGTVYLANHIHLDQLSAVKFLDMDLLDKADEEQQEESLQDFVREAKLAMLLRHDSVVRVMDYGVYETSPFLVMEYVPGPSLLRRMNAGQKFSIEQSLNIISCLADALNAFHERKLVHRDLKPANVILDPRDNGKLTLVDLGLVKDLSSEARSSTHPLALRGTPGYLAPEQVPSWVLSSVGANPIGEKQPVDARVDIFALGVLAYELLAGQPPYPKGLNPSKVIIHTCTQSPAPIESLCPEIHDYPGLAELVRSMMAKHPSQRPNDGREVMQHISEILEDLRDHGNPRAVRGEIHRAQNALVQHMNAISEGVNVADLPHNYSPNHNSASRVPQRPSVSLIPSPQSMRGTLPHHSRQAKTDGDTDESTITTDLNGESNLSLDMNPVSFNESPPVGYQAFHHNEQATKIHTHRTLDEDFDDDQTEIFDEEKTEFHSQSRAFVQDVFTQYESLSQGKPKKGFKPSLMILVAIAIVSGLVLSDVIFTDTPSKPPQAKVVRLGSPLIPTKKLPSVKPRTFKSNQMPMPAISATSTYQNIRQNKQRRIEPPVLPPPPPKKSQPIKTVKKRATKKRSSYKKQRSTSTAKKTRSSKPTPEYMSERNFKLLKHRLNSFKHNQNDSGARTLLKKTIKKMNPQDPHYMDVKYLLDAFEE